MLQKKAIILLNLYKPIIYNVIYGRSLASNGEIVMVCVNGLGGNLDVGGWCVRLHNLSLEFFCDVDI